MFTEVKLLRIHQRRLLPFYLSYAVGLVVPILLGVVLFVRTSALAEREVDARVRFTLEQAATDLESIYGEVEFIVAQASVNEAIDELSATAFPEPRTKYRRLLQHVFDPAFVDTTSFSRFISRFYLILPRPRVALTSGGVVSLQSFHEHEFQLAETSLEDFLSSYLAPTYNFAIRRERVVLGAGLRPTNVIIMLHTLSAAASTSDSLLVLLNTREIREELEAASFAEGSAVFIVDRQGTVLDSLIQENRGFPVSPPPAPARDDIAGWQFPADSAEYTVASPSGRIRLVARVARQVFTSRAAFVRRTTLLFVILVIVIDSLVVTLLSRRNARPVSQMMTALQTELESPPADTKRTGLPLIEWQLDRLLERKHGLEEELQRQKPMIDSLILQGLIQGIQIPDPELRAQLSRAGIDLTSGFISCIVLSFDPVADRAADDIYGEVVVKKLVIEQFFQRRVFGDMYYLHQSFDRLVVIHRADERQENTYRRRLLKDLRRTVAQLRDELEVPFVVGVGNPYHEVTGIHTSYQEATVAAERHAPLSPSRFAAYSDYVDANESYYFPIELELKLLNATRQGSNERIRATMSRLRAENFQERSLSRESTLLLFAELKGTVAKLNASIETAGGAADERATALTQERVGPDSWDTFLSDVESCLLSIGRVFREQARTARSGIDRDEVERFVQAHFRDPNLSLASSADHFGVSEKYFSRYFKEKFQINFHTYIESIRLEYVRRRMIETDASIQDIVANSGYASTVTFSRAFKKKFGLNPSVYRQSARESL